MIHHAFKEWAVVCRALATGRQSLILRKGGIADEGGLFRPEHERFLLYPTFLHQQRDCIKPEAMALLEDAISNEPPAGIVRFTHWVEVTSVRQIAKLEQALALDPLHVWSAETVKKRFHYRQPGLYCLALRVHQLEDAHEEPVLSEYDGCKTWVELRNGIGEANSTLVAGDPQDRLSQKIESLLQ